MTKPPPLVHTEDLKPLLRSLKDTGLYCGYFQQGILSKVLVNQKRFLVEWGHCDPAGIVFFPQYLAWFDECTTALFAKAGMPIHQLLKASGIVGIPLVDVKTTFLVPSTFGDQLLAKSSVSEFRRSSFVIHHQFFKSRTLAVDGFETRVWTARDPDDPERLKSRPLPPEVIERLSGPRHRGKRRSPGTAGAHT
ncbi:MAG TPA: thioesterase family protein [Terriglobia bacterium]|nr:thioesterase family protein [Terriglobia bacterium]